MNARDKLFNWDVSFEDLMCFNFNNPNVINFVDADDYAFDSKYDHYIDTDCDSNTAASISVTQQNSNINNSTINVFTSTIALIELYPRRTNLNKQFYLT